MSTTKIQKRTNRRRRIRSRVSGTADCPRFSVFRSNKNITAQLIDDVKGETLAYVTTQKVAGDTLKVRSEAAGKQIAEMAVAKKIKKVVFDRGGYIFIGNIKTLADAARANGLEF